MKTIDISLIVEDEDIECYGRDDFEVTFDRHDDPDIIIDTLTYKGKDVSHLIDSRFSCICEAIHEYYRGEADYKAEEQFELGRGN